MKTAKKKAKPFRFAKKYIDAVNLGVKWLDLTLGRKEWLSRMDMSNFDIESGSTCVAGNVFKNSSFGENGYEAIENFLNDIGAHDEHARRFGFAAESDRGWQQLQDLWLMKIKALKAAARRK